MTTANASARSIARRGSAMVELSLAMLMFVPLLLYAGYTTDLLFARLKIQEAAAAALWDYTGRLLHDYGSFAHSSKYGPASSSVQGEVQKWYQGLDPWMGVQGKGSSALIGAGAKAQLDQVTCQPGGSAPDPSTLGNAVVSELHTGGLVQCQSRGEVWNWYLGRATAQTTEWRSPVWTSALIGSSLTFCGAGNSGGSTSCGMKNALVVYTDDWGLSQSGDEQATGPDNNANTDFYNVTKNAFDKTYPSGAGIAEWTLGVYDPLVDPPVVLDTKFGEHMLTYESYATAQPVTSDGDESGKNSNGAENNYVTSSPASDVGFAGRVGWDGETGASSQESSTWPYNNNGPAEDFAANPEEYQKTWQARTATTYLGK